MTAAKFFLSSLALTALAGCNLHFPKKPQPLSPQAFMSPRTADEPAQAVQANNAGPAHAITPLAQLPDRNAEPTNAAAVQPPAPATLPAIGLSSGQFMTLGGVVAEVNSTPIYANKVLSTLDPIFREKARQLDPTNFRRQAAVDIRKTIEELIRIELFYAAAQRTLDADDKKLAELLTMQWRMQQITKAGGSVELARRQAREDSNADFDELAQEKSRTKLLEIYDQKKIIPRIQVSAADIREFYDKNVDKLFSEPERVKFRLLKVDIQKTGGKDEAIKKIAEKYKRAQAGEDFKDMAMKENDEKIFAAAEPLEMAPASFAIVKVRDVLPKLQIGQVSEIIEDQKAFYLVRLEDRKTGRVQPFEEQAVQNKIRNVLRNDQYRKLREQDFLRLMKSAAIRQDEEMTNIAIDMAMQKYAQYAAAK